MDPPLTLGQLFDGISPVPQYLNCGPDTSIRALVVDSRTVEPGVAFLALRGETNDSHRFVAQARSRGAAVVIVQDDRIDSIPGPVVRVADSNADYPQLAANAFGRPGEHLTLAGVTGTNGKTTTAHLVGAALSAAHRPHARLGTTGNWIVDRETRPQFTTPFPLELQALLASARQRGATHAVMEVSSHALVQGRARPLHFDTVGLTSFSQDHLDFHPTMDEYLAAKCELTAHHLSPQGLAVAAVDPHPDAAHRFLAAAPAGARRWRVSKGSEPHAEILAERIEYTPRGIRAHVRTPAGSFALHSPLIGDFNLDNLLVGLGLGLGLGLPPSVIIEAFTQATGAPGRLEAVGLDHHRSGPSVLVDYAHTPDAIARAIAAVRPACRGRLVVVLGCGGDRDPSKRPLMGQAAAQGSDRLWVTSDNPRSEDPEAIIDGMLQGLAPDDRAQTVRCTDRAAAIAGAIAEAHDDDLILIAGKGHEDYQILADTTVHFDDREHAHRALEARSRSSPPMPSSRL